MAILITDSGLFELAQNAMGVGGTAPGALKVDLYANNYAPTNDSVLSDFVLCTFPGYGQAFISVGNLIFTLFPPSVVTIVNGTNPLSWVNEGPDTVVYGYLVRSSNTGTVLWAEYWGAVAVEYKQTIAFDLQLEAF